MTEDLIGPTDLVASFARAHGILDLAPDDDTQTLAALIHAGPEPVVLTRNQEAAYERLTGRALAMFHLNDPLARSTEGSTDERQDRNEQHPMLRM